ncbi:MAG: hypothetical protein ACK5QT_07730 [Oligoflexia bacterium]
MQNQTRLAFGAMILLAQAVSVQAQEPAGGPVQIQVSFEKFVAQCSAPEKSEVQRAPREIRVVCDNREVNWVAAQPGELPLSASRSVTTAILSDKFKVATASRAVPTVARAGTCHRFQEVVETYSLEIPMTCEDITSLKVPVEELCASALEDGKEKNVKAIQMVPTGRVLDTCLQAR